jgi:Family of unknown function (DUF5675)
MTDLKLIRTASGPLATMGYCDLPTGERLFTIEPPWKDNQADISCVPPGAYTLTPYHSPEHGPTWYLVNEELGVGGRGALRSYCELHSANWARQLEGCIAFGLDDFPMLDPVDNTVEPAVEHSVDAIEALLQSLVPMSTGNTLSIVYADGVVA